MDPNFEKNLVDPAVNFSTRSSCSSNVFQSPSVSLFKDMKCKIVLKDIFSSNNTAKFKLLNNNQAKNHSVNSQQLEDKVYLENLYVKEPIAWPKACNKDDWAKLDALVSNKLNEGSPFELRTELNYLSLSY